MSIKTYSLDEIISYARSNSKYYASLYKNIPQNASLEELPLIDQDDFWKHCDSNGGTVATRIQTDGQIFKSGGTTGEPKYSLYSAEEWSTMCECSGAVLPKGGLKNGTKIANLFSSGGLYASFLYTYSMFMFAPRKTLMYNLSGNISIEEIVETVLKCHINCLAGFPSVLVKIISYIQKNNITGFDVDTIYYAGETMYEDQREKICKVFGRKIEFRSILYASNDGGPIGYFTKDCGFNEHRVMSDLCKLELIDTDSGEVIHEMNRPGTIYITSLFKTLVPLIRYPAGDLAEYVEPEGIPNRKFKILGRNNVSARISHVTLYPQDLKNVLKMCNIEYYAYQIIITHNIKDQFIFRIAVPEIDESKTEKFINALYKERVRLKEMVYSNCVEIPKVEWCKVSDLEYNERTGKLKSVIDKRNK